jgi:aminoglycoside/choline kinase family phosphotransferase
LLVAPAGWQLAAKIAHNDNNFKHFASPGARGFPVAAGRRERQLYRRRRESSKLCRGFFPAAAVMPERLEQLKRWLDTELTLRDYTIAPASADASFRRYFRVRHGGSSFIVMDAPPEKEDSRPFVDVARRLFGAGLNVPEVLDQDLAQGFLLLSDLGSTPYLGALNETSVERLYGDALGALVSIQACACDGLPPYDRALLLREMELFREWLVGKHLGIALDTGRQAMLDAAFGLLADNALGQPQVFVHRDYHSRNLMLTGRNNPGILDFQDAVCGALTYDLVSLLKDCYIAWPRAQVEDWALGYQELALQSGVLREEHEDPQQFLRWFDLMGAQRHLKAAGIFARLNHRDGKPGYLADIPRTLGYITDLADRHPELDPLAGFIDHYVLAGLRT